MAMPSRRTRAWASASVTVALATVALAGGAQAAPPPAGMPVQLVSPNACYSTTAAGGCTALEGRSIQGAEPIAISGDGLNVYAGGNNGGSGFAFSRGAGGALSAIGGTSGFGSTAFAMNGAGMFVALRDSGSNNGGVQAFARGAGGTLSFANEVLDSCVTEKPHCEDNNNGLYDVEGIAVAPNGERVYAASENGGGGAGGALTVFSRNAATQAITQLQCVPRTLAAKSGLCHEGTAFAALEGAHGVAVSPDGKFLYATGYFASSVMGFNIVQSGPNAGKIASAVNCLWGGASGECAQTAGMNSPNGIALSPDGRDVYVAMFNGGITALRRDPLSGVLSFNQCFTQAGGGGCAADAALVVGARDVVVSPDGSHVYLSGGSGINGYLRAYARDGLTGTLNPLGCLTYLAIPGCSTAAGMANTDKLAISPDGRNLYLTAFEGGDGEGAVAAFRIQTAPTCQSTSVGVLAGSSANIPLACTDEGGDPIVRKIVAAPGKGTLGGIDQAAGTVTYTPAAGFTGSDSFAFQASDGTNESAPASVSLTVTAAPVTAGPAPPPAGGGSRPAGPHSRILALARRVRASKLKSFHGAASGGRPIARVEIALVRLLSGAHVSAAKRRSKARCLQLNGKGRLDTLKVIRGRCAAPHFLLANGTSKWTFRLRRRLPPGSYVLTSRATDTSGTRESAFSASLGNRISFTVR